MRCNHQHVNVVDQFTDHNKGVISQFGECESCQGRVKRTKSTDPSARWGSWS